MNAQAVPVEKLKPNSWNPNVMDPRAYKDLKQGLARNGPVQTLIVRKSGDEYEILDGEHRWRAAKDLGLQHLPAFVLEADDAEARVLCVRLNRDRGRLNPWKVAQALREIASLGVDPAQATGYRPEEVQAYLARLEQAPAPQWSEPSHYAFSLSLDSQELQEAQKALAIPGLSQSQAAHKIALDYLREDEVNPHA